MKLNNVDIVFVEETGNGMRAFNLPGTLLVALSLVAFCLALFLTWMLLDYRDLKPRTGELSKAEAFHAQQKKQIAYLAHRIRTVQEKIKELESCDFKLRAVAHISAGEEGRSLVGVGGSNPGGIDGAKPKPPVTARKMGEDHSITPSSAPEKEPGGIREFLQTEGSLACRRPIQWPAKGWVCSKFGFNADPFDGSPKFRRGVDIATKEKAPVSAPAGGVVTSVDWREGYGRTVVLAHGLGLVSVLSHLDDVFVARGDRLQQGDVIGTAGGTGKSTGPYVRYEIHLYGVPVDPHRHLTFEQH